MTTTRLSLLFSAQNNINIYFGTFHAKNIIHSTAVGIYPTFFRQPILSDTCMHASHMYMQDVI